MRNLKRVLSLALALVMVLGMMVITSSAATYTDAEEITQTEAVEVLTKLGIVNGMGDGTFAPNGTFTREQAAKMITYMKLGPTTAEKLAGTDVFTDVAATRWSAKYIAYCANLGIIAGLGDGTFNPTGELTDIALGKMILVALGYDSADYVGSNWATAVAVDMLDAGLVNNVTGVAITREDACLMMLNGMKAGVTETKYVVNGIEFEDKGDALLYYAIAGDVTFTTEYHTTDSLLNDVYDADYGRTTDAFGRPGTLYTCDDWAYGEFYQDTPVATYTTKVTGGAMYSKFGRNAVYNGFVDGKETDVAGNISSGNARAVGVSANGVLTEVYYMGKNLAGAPMYNVVQVNTYVGKIADHYEEVLNDDGEIDEYESVDVSGFSAPCDAAYLDSNIITYDFTAADKAKGGTVVLYTAAYYATDEDGNDYYYVDSVEKAESVTLVATWMKDMDSFKADGETYKYSANADSYVDADNVNDEDELVVYVDEYGYAIKVKPVTVKDEYAILLDGNGATSGVFTGDAQYYAKLLYTDGTVGVVETAARYTEIVAGSIVKYTTNAAGKIVLTDETDDSEAVANYKTGNAAFGTTTANSKTVFVVKTGTAEKPVYTVYTGIANMPGLTSATVSYMENNQGVATIVYVTAPTFSDAATKDVVYVSNTYSVEADVEIGNYYKYNAVVNGEITTINTAEYEMFGFDTGMVVNKYGLVTTSEGLAGTGIEVYYGATSIEEASNGIVEIGGTYYAYNDSTLVFEVNGAGRFTATDIDSFEIPETAYTVDFYTVNGILAMIVIG